MKISMSIIILLLLASFLFSAPGDLIWRYETGGFVRSSPCISNGVVFVGSNDSYLYAINCSNATLKWKYKTGGNDISTSPCVSDEIVYFAGHDSYFYAINCSDGTLKWRYLFDHNNYPSSPCVHNSLVFEANDLSLYAFNIFDGTLAWKYTHNNTFERQSYPCIRGGYIYFGLSFYDEYRYGCYLMSFYSYSGKDRCSCKTDDLILSLSSREGPGVYAGCRDTYLYSISYTSCSLLWKYKTSGRIYSTPFAIDDVVYVGSTDHYLYAINSADGTLKWRYFTGTAVYSSPCVSEGVVYVGSDDDYLYAINCSDGTLKWRYLTDGNVYSSPCVSDGVVYVGSNDTYLYAIETYGYNNFKENKSASYIPAKSFSVSPNPFAYHLSISSTSPVSIYSLTGHLIMNLDKGKHSVDTSKWREGVYIVKVGKETKRVVKVK